MTNLNYIKNTTYSVGSFFFTRNVQKKKISWVTNSILRLHTTVEIEWEYTSSNVLW